MSVDANEGSSLERFVSRYEPTEVTPVGSAFLRYAEEKVPATLVELYRTHGIGWYGHQQLLLVDPGEWMPVLQTWLGAGVRSVPFAVTSFGHVYHVDEDGRVQCLDPHFLKNTVVASSLEEFFGTHLLDGSSHVIDLRGPHQGARTKLGLLGEGELYYFTPMLPLGGTVSPQSLTKGNGVQHALLTHRMVREQRGL